MHDGYFSIDKKKVGGQDGGSVQGHQRRRPTPRRHLQPDHAGQGEAAELRDAAQVHLLPLRAAGRLGQPERLPDLRVARHVHRARAPADDRPRPAPLRQPGRRAPARLRRQHADRHRHRELRAVRREPAEGNRGRHRHPLRHRGDAPVRRRHRDRSRRPAGTAGLRRSRRRSGST